MNRTIRYWILIPGLLAGLAVGAYFLRQHLEYVAMHTIPPDLKAFKVTDPVPVCARWKDHMPSERNAEAYRIYTRARKLWRSKVEWEFTHQELLGILKDVEAAAQKGDWGARALLAHFYLEGLGPLDTNHVLDEDGDKSVEIARSAVKAGQAWGYYDVGVAHEHGYGGAAQDENLAWAYYLKAAELGSPDAQMALASAYEKAKRKDAAQTMYLCAYNQGHGPAALELGTTADVLKKFAEATIFYQAGTKFGNKACAVALMILFDSEDWYRRSKEEQTLLRRLNITADLERNRRYEAIANLLELNPDLKLTRIDKVLPLPPAELVPWNGVNDAVEPEGNGPPTY